MQELFIISDLPNRPAVYALYGGRDQKYVAYVGIGGKLKQRIVQHMIRRNSSVVTGASMVSLNPDLVTEICWWEHPEFVSEDVLEAAEWVATDCLNPTLRSRGTVSETVRAHLTPAFKESMRTLFQTTPSGRLKILSLPDALQRLAGLEKRVSELEKRLKKRGGS